MWFDFPFIDPLATKKINRKYIHPPDSPKSRPTCTRTNRTSETTQRLRFLQVIHLFVTRHRSHQTSPPSRDPAPSLHADHAVRNSQKPPRVSPPPRSTSSPASPHSARRTPGPWAQRPGSPEGRPDQAPRQACWDRIRANRE